MIHFKTIRWKNFLSTGSAFTEIKLDAAKNSLVVGKNGSGKSTLLDALTFALFGKPFRNINKPTLVNSVNEKNLIVEIEFNTNNKDYKIVRGLKPNVFEIYCNGKMLNQDSAMKDYQEYLEKYILKINYKSFTQIVILGSASFTPFMQLSAADRRAIIEDLLDIKIFTVMNVIAKQKLNQIFFDLEALKFQEDVLTEAKKVLADTVQKMEEHQENQLQKLEDDYNEHRHNLKLLETEVADLIVAQTTMINSTQNTDSIKQKHSKLIELQTKIQHNLKKHKKDISFYHDNTTCPTCKQVIDDLFKDQIITKTKEKVVELDDGLAKLDDELSKVIESMRTAEEHYKEIQKLQHQILEINAKIKADNRLLDSIQANIDAIKKADTLSQDNKQKLQDTIQDLTKVEAAKKELKDNELLTKLGIDLLKDGGVKSKIIKQYLPVFNKTINTYLSKMGFFVNFMIDENFNETIKSRFRDEFSYENFSEGEKSRIDLALLFTWRAISKMKNSMNTNLLILDEVFDGSLDADGMDELLKIIKDITAGTNVFILSPKGDHMVDKFDKVYRFKRVKNFSQMEEHE